MGRDHAIIAALLRESALAQHVSAVAEVAALAAALNNEICFAVATEEALVGGDLRELSTWVKAQPPWSDLPFIILTERGGGPERNPAAARTLDLLGNVTFLERPFHPTTFISVARTAVRGRGRQFEARSLIEALHEREEALREANETLEQRVAERTGALNAAHQSVLEEMAQRQRAEEQLHQAQKMEAMGQITGGVAHDFNNLLLAVLANLDLLRSHLENNAEALSLVDGAIQGAQRGASLTQRLLAFARRQTLKVEPIDLSGLVSGMLDLVAHSLGSRIELNLRLRPGLPMAMVDANQLELALLNLLVNARDAMPDGGVATIELAARSSAGDRDLVSGNYVCLSVIDTGHGMDAQTLARAIDPFFSTKEPGKGTGLGLSMIDGLAKQMHGRLRLSSEVGVGTRAELWLPAAAAPAGEARATATAQATPDPEPPPPAPATAEGLAILFVEDDPLIAMATIAMLKKLGHRVSGASSGPKALALIERGDAFDLLITDYAMPKMTGMQLAETVRAIRPTLPIVLATGYAELPEGSTLHLPRIDKPYTMKDLAQMIEGVVAGRS